MLLDTHVLLNATGARSRVRPGVADALAQASTVLVSAVSPWEIAIKRALGRLAFPLEEWDELLAITTFVELPVTAAHGIEAGALPRLHSDPFDRLLIAQARKEGALLVTDDAMIARYDVPLLSRP